MRDAVRIVRGWGFAVGASIGLAMLRDWLLYQRVIGWSAGLLLLAALAAVVIHAGGMLRRREGLLSVLLVMGVAPAFFEQPSVLAGAMAALLLGICAMVGRGNWSGRVLVWARRWLVLLVRGPLQGPLDVALSGRWLWRHPRKRGGPIVWRVARWIVPLGVGLVFAGLFALANPVLGTWARTGWDRVATLLAWLPDLLAPQRVVLWMVVGMAAYALLRYRQAPWARGGGLEAAPIAGAGLGAGLVVRSLLVLNAVFGLQTALDIVYLWGGAELPHHLTYAQYAHRGAYTLVATALLAALLVLACFRRGGRAGQSSAARRLVFLWIAQNVFLMVSTIWRLWLYVDAYSLTRWRIAAMIWVGMVAVGFGWIVVKIVAGRSNAWLCRVNVVTLLAVLYVCAYCNFGGWIADFNVRHCWEVNGGGARLDVAYLRDLGVVALPAVEWVKGRVEVGAVERVLREQLGHELADWRGWTWERSRVAEAVPPLDPGPEARLRPMAWRGR